jgi:lysophospholipase L1-like esterase
MKQLIFAIAALTLTSCGPSTESGLPPVAGLGVRLSGDVCAYSQDIPPSIVASASAQFQDPPVEPPPVVTAEDRAAYAALTERQRAEDWANLCRFRTANGETRIAGMESKVVFMGDSITQLWAFADPDVFSGGNRNRGISGQTTPQMLIRFRADVVNLKPAAVHILAGINDIAGNTGPTTLTDMTNNIQSMVEIAKANGITVILATPLPADHFNWQPDQKPAEAVAALAAWIRRYAAEQNLILADYYPVLATPDGALKPDLGPDGVHPNKAGYALMKPILEAAIAEALRR